MNKFVFAVCGAENYISQLAFSIERLKRFTHNEIIVVTDSRRNEIPISHENIIDIKTPSEYDNHQASIFLKTSLHKILPKGDTCCYLDSDVVCLSEKVNEIFNHYSTPITFANDNAPLEYFSPHAMNCKCLENHAHRGEIIAKFKADVAKRIGKFNLDDESISQDRKELVDLFAQTKHNFCGASRYFFLRYLPFVRSFTFGKFVFNKSEMCWRNSNGEVVELDFRYYKRLILSQLGENPADWTNFELDTPHCNHLSEYLSKTYGINIPDIWQHWNGGVFLFDDSSAEFLDYWHEKTIAEFANPYTKTRDQGTLALTVWKFGLQNHPTLPVEYNWIAEFADANIDYDANKGYTRDGFKTISHPVLMHIYHHWGDDGWNIWKSLDR
ncbi:MAG: hypothetical protein IK025_00090 [Bacteroidales bacterium]|nr:hypothetical protein [Bacteroidales bacterium]